MAPSGANAIPYLQRKIAKTDNRRGWHLDKSVNLPFLFSLLVALFCVLSYMQKQDQRQTRSEERIENLNKQQEEVKNELKNIKADIKVDLNRFEDKMDRYFKKGN